MKSKNDNARVAAANWQTSLAYKRVFNSEDGKTVLSDMKERFGYNRTSCPAGIDPYGAFHNEGCKEPLRHIDWHLDRSNRDEDPKPTEAING